MLFVLNSKRFIFDILVIVPQLLIFRLQILFCHHFVIDYVVSAGHHLFLLSETYVIEFASCIILQLQVRIIDENTLVFVAFLKGTFREISQIDLILLEVGIALGVFIDIMSCILCMIIIVPSKQRIIFLTFALVLFVNKLHILILHFLIGYMSECSTIK